MVRARIISTQLVMAETGHGQATAPAADGKGLVGASAYSGSDGKDNGGGSFGLGVGFALSPELAQKVRFNSSTNFAIYNLRSVVLMGDWCGIESKILPDPPFHFDKF